MFYVYVLRSQKDKRFYTGFTRDVSRRIARHNSEKVESTRNRRPLNLLYLEEYESESNARSRERYLKSWEGRLWLHKYLQNHGERSSIG